MPTAHYERVRTFMRLAGQDTPRSVTEPDGPTRLLRARLILEEALETVTALGVDVRLGGHKVDYDTLQWRVQGDADLLGVVDGCADISVVTMGTLIAFGVKDEPVLEAVDHANLRKFGPGAYTRADGKWIKPPDWTPPDLKSVIGRMSNAGPGKQEGP